MILLITILLLFGIDKLLKHKNELTRWYTIHSFGNLIVTIVTFPKLVILLSDPIRHIQNPIRSDESNWIVGIIHAYHIIFFKCNRRSEMYYIIYCTVFC